MSLTLTIANEKGGVGKTTTVISLGVALAASGRSVLLVDMDPQAAVARSLKLTPAPGATMAEVLLGERRLEDVLIANVTGVTLAPGSRRLKAVATSLLQSDTEVLRRVLAEGPRFDYTIIDTEPTLHVLTTHALYAARKVLIPVQTEFLSLEGVSNVLEEIRLVRRHNRGLQILGVLPTMFDSRIVMHELVLDQLRDLGKQGVHVFDPVPRTARFAYASLTGSSIFDHSKEEEACAEAYRAVARALEEGRGR